MIPRILADLALLSFFVHPVEEGFATLARGRALADATGNGEALLRLAARESDALLKTGSFAKAADVALGGLHAARQAGLGGWFFAMGLAATAAEALLWQGRTADVAALIDPLTTGPPGRDDWFVHIDTQAVKLDRHQARLGMQLGQRIADEAGSGHGIHRRPRDRLPRDIAHDQFPRRKANRSELERPLARQLTFDHRPPFRFARQP